MKFDLIAEFATRDEVIAFHKATPADAYNRIGPYGGRNNRRIKKPFLAYQKAERDWEWKSGRIDMLVTNYVTDPALLRDF